MKILVASFMRLNSERIPGKLLTEIHGCSLAEIMTMKLKTLHVRLAHHVDVALAISPNDDKLVAIAERHGCAVLMRSETSRNGETCEHIYGELRETLRQQGFERLVVINPCLPFLSVEKIAEFVRAETESAEFEHGARVAVIRHRGPVWDSTLRQVCGDSFPNSKVSPEYYTCAHAMDSCPVDLLGTAAQTDYRHFAIYAPSPEFLDIDTEFDLQIARGYAQGLLMSQDTIDWTV